MKFHVTYDTVTPESAEHGDIDDCGYVTPGGWRYSSRGVHGDEARKLGAECALTMREALKLFNGYCAEDNGDGFREVDGRQNYVTGASELRTLHTPDSMTPASYARLRRILARG